MKTTLCIYFLLSMLLFGCANPQKNEIPTQNPDFASITPNIKATSPVVNTPVQIAACAYLDDVAKSKFDFVGEIVIKDDDRLSLCNLKTGTRQLIPDTENSLYFTVSFSPDYKRFSYINFSNDLVIVSTLGEKQIIGLQEDVGSWAMDWLNDKEISFVLPTRDDGSMTVYNIDTGEFQQVITNIEDINNLDPISWYSGAIPVTILDPSLSRLIYLSYDLPSIGGHGFVMMDWETHSVLWQRAGIIGAKPAWTPDGNFAAIAINSTKSDRIYIVNREGEEADIIDFENDYPDAVVLAQNMKWSPDGKRLGFISKFFSDKQEKEILFVYDLQSKTSNKFEIGYPSRIIWSPDGSQILVNGYLINIATNQRFELMNSDEGFEPLGWLQPMP